MWERIPVEVWESQRGHVERYELVKKSLIESDMVFDAACGVGYGKEVMGATGYVGVDREPVTEFGEGFITEDLDTWEPDFDFSVGVCFETLEHIQNPERWLKIMLRAKRLAFFSVPTVPTKHMNEFHLHDFTVGQVAELLKDYPFTIIPQPQELSHIFIVDCH
jgi:hypothetical protein